MIAALLGKKGGIKKSTLARALAVEGSRSGLKVLLADLDTDQTSSVSWHGRRIEHGLAPCPDVQAFPAPQEVRSPTHDLTILDTPGRADAQLLSAAQKADVVFQPSGPSLDDLEPAIRVFHSLVRRGIPKARLHIVLTGVQTQCEEDLARAYVAASGYSCLQNTLEQKASYAAAQNSGRAITEVSHPSPRQKADTLIQEMIDVLAYQFENETMKEAI